MTTVVNNPGGGDNGGSAGIIVAIIVLILLAWAFVVYGLPMIRGGQAPQQKAGLDINLSVPTGGSQGGGGGNAAY